MEYYIILDGKQIGPLDIEQIFEHPVTPETKIWREGLSEWIFLREEPTLLDEYNKHNVTPPPFASHQSPNPMAYMDPVIRPPKPPTYLAWSIINTIICCLPAGIVAIIYSCGVDSAYSAGRYEEAASKSKTAYNINLWTTIVLAVLYGLYFLLILVGVISSI